MVHPQTFLPASMSKWAYEKGIDASYIGGNASTEVKRFCLAVLHFFVGTKSTSYGADIGQHLSLVELNIHEEGRYSYAETIFEITAEKEMCNILQILHGACAAYIVDLSCSVASLVALGTAQGFDGTGVSQSMNLVWHYPIHLGQKIQVTSTSVCGKGRIRTMRCELWVNDHLCISAVHSTVNVSRIHNDKPKGKL